MRNPQSLPVPARLRPAWLLSLALSAPALELAAQCELEFRSGPPLAGPRGFLRAIALQANGDPIVGGGVLGADGTVARGITRWNGTSFEALGSGLDGVVSDIQLAADGSILAAGSFQNSGTNPVVGVARWNGTSWQSVGGGLAGIVTQVLELPGGALIATATQVDALRVMRYDGTAWTQLGPLFPSGTVFDLVRLPNGDLVVAGSFSGPTGSGADNVARWDGSAWQALDNFGGFPGTVTSLQVLGNGTLAIGGRFFLDGTQRQIAIWNGTEALPLPSEPPLNAPVRLAVAQNGDLIAGSELPSPVSSLWRWNGNTWTPLPGGGPAAAEQLAVGPQGELVVTDSRNHSNVSTVFQASSVHRFDGQSWSRLGAEVPPQIVAAVALPNGDLIAAGTFARIGGIAAANIARWNGSSWAPLGAGVDGSVRAMTLASNGDVVISGGFQNAGGAPAQGVARWNGNSWFSVGGGLSLPARSLAAAGTEVLTIGGGGGSQLWRFDGASWGPVPAVTGFLQTVVALPDGRFVVGGLNIAGLGSPVAIYDQGTFTPLSGGAMPSLVRQLIVSPDGSLLALSQGAVLSRWNGTLWTQLVNVPLAQAMTQLPDGDVAFGGGAFTLGGLSFGGLSRWDGSSLTPLGPGVRFATPGTVSTLMANQRGELLVAGQFLQFGDNLAAGSALLATPCPAAVQSIGAGCIGAGGPVALDAVNRPWLGGTFRTVGSGLPAGSLALQLAGVSAGAQPLPLGAPGCSLFVDALLLDLLLPQQGRVNGAIAVPATPTIVGMDLFTQVLGLELDANGNLVRLTASNSLRGTVGAL
ncbi:MAG: hypothetical protein MUC36_00905 [Planctomycetes bacterium]|nr:hypothetical protein [Planctomycetota bacterium]